MDGFPPLGVFDGRQLLRILVSVGKDVVTMSNYQFHEVTL